MTRLCSDDSLGLWEEIDQHEWTLVESDNYYEFLGKSNMDMNNNGGLTRAGLRNDKAG